MFLNSINKPIYINNYNKELLDIYDCVGEYDNLIKNKYVPELNNLHFTSPIFKCDTITDKPSPIDDFGNTIFKIGDKIHKDNKFKKPMVKIYEEKNICDITNDNTRISFSFDKITDAMLTKMSHCEEISIFNCRNISDESFKYLSMFKKLKKLNIYWCNNITDKTFEYLSKSNSLETLHIGWMDNISDKTFKYLSKLNSLKTLFIDSMDNITDDIFRYISKLKLKKLKIDYCSQLFTSKSIKYMAKMSELQILKIKCGRYHNICNDIFNPLPKTIKIIKEIH